MNTSPNKAYWRDGEVTGYERKQRLLVPRKDEILETVVEFLPFSPQDRISIVDVGAGQGALSEKALRQFPQAHVTLLDSSQQMLEQARKRLSGSGSRFTIAVGDFNSPDWQADIGNADAVISAIALHYLEPDNRPVFFRKAFQLLKTPGCFINAGSFLSSDPFIQERWDDLRLEYTRRTLLETEGRDMTIDELRKKGEAERTKAGVNRYPLADQIRFLSDAEFRTVEVVWQYLSFAVVVAYK